MADTLFSRISLADPDAILGVTTRFKADPRPNKVNLGVGIYLNNDGQVPVLNVVHEAEEAIVAQHLPHPYLPISGLPGLSGCVQRLLFGDDSEVIQSRRAVTVQSLGGTGALKVGMDFLNRICRKNKAAVSRPTWGNHICLLEMAGFTVNSYRYYDATHDALGFDAMMYDLGNMPTGTVLVLHACCHNPTGYDLSEEQWKAVISLCQSRGLIPLLDIAYQGFGLGLQEDALAIRLFAASGMSFLVASSFSKSFNLYNERIGALTVVTASETEAKTVASQLDYVMRANFSSPPSQGARIVFHTLSNETRFNAWCQEVANMRTRIRQMREALAREMATVNAKRDFSFVTRQKGMFSFTGLTPDQIERLEKEFAIYAVKNGRICICGLNNQNVAYVARSIAAVL